MSDERFDFLTALQVDRMHFTFVRRLAEDEFAKVAVHREVYATARNRFRLFQILQLNFEAWQGFISSLETRTSRAADEMLELDRLMLNYLSSARALLDHFSQYYIQLHRHTRQQDDFNDFVEGLRTNDWTFAFFQDFRNFVQHCGLPTGAFEMTDSGSRREVKVEVDADWLVRHYNGWGACNLTRIQGRLDLIELTEKYHAKLVQDVGKFLAQRFFPKLVETHNFFASLATEVSTRIPNSRAVLLPELRPSGNDLILQFSQMPNDVFSELGLIVTTKQPLGSESLRN